MNGNELTVDLVYLGAPAVCMETRTLKRLEAPGPCRQSPDWCRAATNESLR